MGRFINVHGPTRRNKWTKESRDLEVPITFFDTFTVLTCVTACSEAMIMHSGLRVTVG